MLPKISPLPTLVGSQSSLYFSLHILFVEKYDGLTYWMVKYDDETQQSKGCGFVSFDTDESADKALAEMNMTELCGRQIKVQPAVSYEARAEAKRLRDETAKQKQSERDTAKAKAKEARRLQDIAYLEQTKGLQKEQGPRNKAEKKV